MTAQEFHRRTTRDESDFLDRFLETLRDLKAPFCVIGGQGVNAYAEPVVSLDLDVVVVAERVSELESILRTRFKVERFEHSLNVSAAGSDLRVQIQYDPRYQPFLSRCDEHTVLGRVLPVAALNDVLQGKLWAYQDQTCRPSKRQKDLADIARLIEDRPELAAIVPREIRQKIG